MQRGCLISIVVIVALLLLLGFGSVGTYNGLVTSQERISPCMAQVDNQYKRRYDLIPQLVETVKGAADFEQTTLQEVIDARASVGRVSLPEKLPEDPAALQAYLDAQSRLGSALGRLFAVSEAYPQLRATESFRDLQAQIEGTENRIAVARHDFIEAVRAYNTARRRFPGNLFASAFGFDEAAMAEPEPEVRETPVIDFGNDG